MITYLLKYVNGSLSKCCRGNCRKSNYTLALWLYNDCIDHSTPFYNDHKQKQIHIISSFLLHLYFNSGKIIKECLNNKIRNINKAGAMNT